MKITVERQITIVLTDEDANSLQKWLFDAWKLPSTEPESNNSKAGFANPVVQEIYNALIGLKP